MKEYWFEEHSRGERTLLVLLYGERKGPAEILGSFEVPNVDECVKWQKAVAHVNTMSKS